VKRGRDVPVPIQPATEADRSAREDEIRRQGSKLLV
jgi:hypothetical protein